RRWLGRLLAPDTPVGGLAREWLGIDSVGDHFGRRLLGQAATARLADRATLSHSDDRPALEFVAARRFLDPLWDPAVFDSLIAIGASVGDVAGTSPVLLARAMTAPRVLATQLEILEAAHRAVPADPVWTVRFARARAAAGDTAVADSLLRAVLTRSRHPEALLFAAALAERRGDAVPRGGRVRHRRRRRARAPAALPAGRDELGARLLAQGLLDLSRRRDHVVHVARQRARLLGGARQVVQRHRHAGRAQSQQVEPDVLHGQDARLQLVPHQLAPGEQVGQRLALAVEQTHLPVALDPVRLALGRLDLLLQAPEGPLVHAAA